MWPHAFPTAEGTASRGAQAAAVDQTRCILRDAYDDDAFQTLLREKPRLAACSRRGQQRLRSFPELLADLFCLHFKLRPVWIDRDRLRPAFRVNHHLLLRTADEPATRERRSSSGLSETRAAEAALHCAAHLLEELADTDLDEENRLFEFEQSLDEAGRQRSRPGPVRRRAAAGVGPGADARRRRRPLAYDLQERLERGDAIAAALRLEQMLDLRARLRGEFERRDERFAPPREVYDIGLCGELARLLPAELGALRAAPRRLDFLRRLLERQLLGYRLAGGADPAQLWILIDTSHSMEGRKELAAKALALALAETALARRQRVGVLLFGHRGAPPRAIHFAGRHAGKREIEAVAAAFFGGGTDFERPLSATLERVARAPAGTAQIVLISDGLCSIDPGRIATLRLQRTHQRVALSSIVVDCGPSSTRTLAALSDRLLQLSDLTGGRSPDSARPHAAVSRDRGNG